MCKNELPKYAYSPECSSFDEALDDVLASSDDLIKKNSGRRQTDFGLCPNRFTCRGCGRDEYLHFDKDEGVYRLHTKHCPECGEYIRGQVDTMYSNWLVARRRALKKVARTKDLTSHMAFFASVLVAGGALALVHLAQPDLIWVAHSQAICLVIAIGLLLASRHLSRSADATRKVREQIGLNDFVASEFPLKK